jgi:hypothetical protein
MRTRTRSPTSGTTRPPEDEVEKQERGEETEVHDDPARDWAVHVFGLLDTRGTQ